MIRVPEINEEDWDLLQGLRPEIMARLCAGGAVGGGSSVCIDGWTRRTATSKIALLRSKGLISDDELSRFSEATRKTVRFLLDSA